MAHTVTIKHGAFWYYAKVKQVRPSSGKEEEILVQQFANQGDTIDLELDSDYDRGVKYGAFMQEGESIDPVTGEVLRNGEAPSAVAVEASGEVKPGELAHDELVDWLLSTGEFDGRPKPSVPEVIAAVGDDPETAERVIAAEKEATGANPRKSLLEALEA